MLLEVRNDAPLALRDTSPLCGWQSCPPLQRLLHDASEVPSSIDDASSNGNKGSQITIAFFVYTFTDSAEGTLTGKLQ